MDRQEYEAVLRRVNRETWFKEEPYHLRATPEDVALLCPHLSAEQVDDLWGNAIRFEQNNPGYQINRIYIALPPVWVKGPGLYLDFDPRYPKNLARVHSMRGHRPDVYPFYKTPGYSEGSNGFPFYKEALAFAHENWGNELIVQDVQSVCYVHMQRVKDDNSGRREDVVTLRVLLSATEQQLLANQSASPTQVFDDAIVLIIEDGLLSDEALGACNRFFWNCVCGHCGYGFHYARCSNCGRFFQESDWRKGKYFSASPKVLAYLQGQGYEFEQDPTIGLKREHDLWVAGQNALSAAS